jgi:Ni/Co efflux regulator RcnB
MNRSHQALAGLFCLMLAGLSQPTAAQTQHHWRRGDVLPAGMLHAGPNVDYAAQRLRHPPEGYGWFSLDGEYLLASLSSGLILEAVDS